jgi:hypothetical protein
MLGRIAGIEEKRLEEIIAQGEVEMIFAALQTP